MKKILVPVETFYEKTETRERHYVTLKKLVELMKNRGLLCDCNCCEPNALDGAPSPDDFE